jgi:hypothetical protein
LYAKPYSDKPDQYGALLAISGLKDVAMQIAASNFNTHAIGDSTVILKI